MFSIDVPKQIALSVAQLVRCYTLTLTPSWRPCAIVLKRNSNLLESEGLNCTTMELFVWLTSLSYTDKSSNPLGATVVEKYSLEGKITTSDISSQSSFAVDGSSNDAISAYEPIEITVVFVYDSGVRRQIDNAAIVKELEINTPFVFGTSHVLDVNIGFTIDTLDENESRISFVTDSFTEISLANARRKLGDLLSNSR